MTENEMVEYILRICENENASKEEVRRAHSFFTFDNVRNALEEDRSCEADVRRIGALLTNRL